MSAGRHSVAPVPRKKSHLGVGRATVSGAAFEDQGDPFDISGYLQKRGERWNNAWRRRWFEIKDKKLYYFKSHTPGTSPQGTIPLEDITQVYACEDRKCEGFAFELATQKRIYYLAAESPADRRRWVDSLTLVRRLVKAEKLGIPPERVAPLGRSTVAGGNGPGPQSSLTVPHAHSGASPEGDSEPEDPYDHDEGDSDDQHQFEQTTVTSDMHQGESRDTQEHDADDYQFSRPAGSQSRAAPPPEEDQYEAAKGPSATAVGGAGVAVVAGAAGAAAVASGGSNDTADTQSEDPFQHSSASESATASGSTKQSESADKVANDDGLELRKPPPLNDALLQILQDVDDSIIPSGVGSDLVGRILAEDASRPLTRSPAASTAGASPVPVPPSSLKESQDASSPDQETSAPAPEPEQDATLVKVVDPPPPSKSTGDADAKPESDSNSTAVAAAVVGGAAVVAVVGAAAVTSSKDDSDQKKTEEPVAEASTDIPADPTPEKDVSPETDAAPPVQPAEESIEDTADTAQEPDADVPKQEVEPAPPARAPSSAEEAARTPADSSEPQAAAPETAPRAETDPSDHAPAPEAVEDVQPRRRYESFSHPDEEHGDDDVGIAALPIAAALAAGNPEADEKTEVIDTVAMYHEPAPAKPKPMFHAHFRDLPPLSPHTLIRHLLELNDATEAWVRENIDKLFAMAEEGMRPPILPKNLVDSIQEGASMAPQERSAAIQIEPQPGAPPTTASTPPGQPGSSPDDGPSFLARKKAAFLQKLKKKNDSPGNSSDSEQTHPPPSNAEPAPAQRPPRAHVVAYGGMPTQQHRRFDISGAPELCHSLVSVIVTILMNGLKTEGIFGRITLWQCIRKFPNPAVEALLHYVEGYSFAVPDVFLKYLRAALFVQIGLNQGWLFTHFARLVNDSPAYFDCYDPSAIVRNQNNRTIFFNTLEQIQQKFMMTSELDPNLTLMFMPRTALPPTLKLGDAIGSRCVWSDALLEASLDAALIERLEAIVNKVGRLASDVQAATAIVNMQSDAEDKDSLDKLEFSLSVMVRRELADVLAEIFEDGFKHFKIFGSYHLWDVFEFQGGQDKFAAANLEVLRYTRSIAAINATVQNAGDMSNVHKADMKFRSVICAGLNNQQLHVWMRWMVQNLELNAKFFEPWSMFRNPLVYERIQILLEVLSNIQFRLPLDFELRARKGQ